MDYVDTLSAATGWIYDNGGTAYESAKKIYCVGKNAQRTATVFWNTPLVRTPIRAAQTLATYLGRPRQEDPSEGETAEETATVPSTESSIGRTSTELALQVTLLKNLGQVAVGIALCSAHSASYLPVTANLYAAAQLADLISNTGRTIADVEQLRLTGQLTATGEISPKEGSHERLVKLRTVRDATAALYAVTWLGEYATQSHALDIAARYSGYASLALTGAYLVGNAYNERETIKLVASRAFESLRSTVSSSYGKVKELVVGASATHQ